MASRLCRRVLPLRGGALFLSRNTASESAAFECPHEYERPSGFLESWKRPPPSSDPAVGQRKLALLRREYKKQMKEVRRQYAYEMETQRQEKLRKDAARREAVRVAKTEREAAKAAAAKVAAAERKALQEEFLQTLMEERRKKLESWREKEKLQVKRREEKKELLRRQSSMWIEEGELDKRITEALVDTTQL